MGVICFGSLKGGVGKTSLSINVAHALAERGCATLLIDLDPIAHASRFFLASNPGIPQESTLARVILGDGLVEGNRLGGNAGLLSEEEVGSLVSALSEGVVPVRDRLCLLPAGPELRHFLWGRGSRLFKQVYCRAVEELHASFDYIIIDTPPDYNVLVRNSIAMADLMVVPVDSSAMSVHCLEEMVSAASHITGPMWLIVRSMVNKQALRVQRLASDRLYEKLMVRSGSELEEDEDDADFEGEEMLGSDRYMSMLQERDAEDDMDDTGPNVGNRQMSPIYLLNSIVSRSEEQNRLTFLGKTALDSRRNSPLRTQYLSLAKELEFMLSIREGNDIAESDDAPSLPDLSPRL